MSNITLAPLPQWRILIKSLYTRYPSDRDLAKPWLLSYSDVPYWFSRSTFAMLAIARWYEVYTGKKLPTIWIPDYFCNNPLQFLRDSNYPLIFYPINEQLTPNWNLCKNIVLTNKPDIFILVHYFGYPSEGKKARQFCDEHNSILVEDATHTMLPQQGIGSNGEFVLYSCHKLLAIADGSLLVQCHRMKVLRKLSDKQPNAVMEQVLKTIPQESPYAWKWLFKRILQKFLPDYLWLKRSTTGDLDDTYSVPIAFKPLQSKVSRALLSAQLLYINKYTINRQVNSSILKTFNKTNKKTVLFQNNDYIPYMLALQCNTEEYAKEYFCMLKKNRIPVMRWPELSPEVLADTKNHSVALKLKKTLLFFPIHQSLGLDTIKKIGFFINNNPQNTLGLKDYKIEWYEGRQEQWTDFIYKARKSNLLQSWEYGQTKGRVEGWKVKRGLIKSNGNIVAMFQALEKFFGPVGIIRINRGPLLIDENDNNFNTIYNIYKTLRQTWKWSSGKVLLIAPELLETTENIGIMILARFRKRQVKSWKSSLIDLSLSDIDLRKQLYVKWRNQLKRAEQSGIVLDVTRSDESFFWLMTHYEQMMKDRAFKSTSIKFYKELHRLNKNNFHVFRAWFEGQAIAGILIVQHGRACTYQVGWNCPEGRRVYANNFLLWNAILEMKKFGCIWFDLGGIDEIDTHGIAKFKHYIGGKGYTLVGEWY